MREINIPKFLQEFHGKKASLISMIFVYVNAIIFAIVVSYFVKSENLNLWKEILLFVIVADIAGGAIANFTTSTRQYYKENPKLQLPFLLLHIIHPVLLYILLPQFISFSIFMGVFTIISIVIIRLIAHLNDLKIISIFLFIIGNAILLLIPCEIQILRIIPILFFLKIILGFAVGVFQKK